jgi:hypothetical protein
LDAQRLAHPWPRALPVSSKKGSGGCVGPRRGIIVGLGCVACTGAQQHDDAVELASIKQTKASGSACASIEACLHP